MSGLSYLVENLPYEFCPGCSHGQVVDALGGALAKMSPEADKVALVSDIGCVGLVDKYFHLNTLHGLHGRSITYGTGLKLARPDLKVIVVLGDGGCGIGGHHLIQAARRGTDITVVVFNNFNYGMTGGEHSSTTPIGAMTSSTLEGNQEKPLDLCGLAKASGATFVARIPAFDKELPDIVARACEHPGFALIDIWELCTAYFMPRNAFKKKQLLELSEASNMPFGVLVDEPPPPPEGRTGLRIPERTTLTVDSQATLSKSTGYLIAGSAGQKVKSAATTLGRAGIRAGLFATQKDDYPITVKTGHSVSEIILSPKPIVFTGIESPDIALVLTEDGLSRCRKTLELMPPESKVLIDKSLEAPPLRAKTIELDFAGASKRVGKENVSLWAISRMLSLCGGVPIQALLDTVTTDTPGPYRPLAIRAVENGASET